jgi:hypothetical protein
MPMQRVDVVLYDITFNRALPKHASIRKSERYAYALFAVNTYGDLRMVPSDGDKFEGLS